MSKRNSLILFYRRAATFSSNFPERPSDAPTSLGKLKASRSFPCQPSSCATTMEPKRISFNGSNVGGESLLRETLLNSDHSVAPVPHLQDKTAKKSRHPSLRRFDTAPSGSVLTFSVHATCSRSRTSITNYTFMSSPTQQPASRVDSQ